MPQQIENKKVTLYAIVEDVKETEKKLKKSFFEGLDDSNEEKICSFPLFPSFRGSLVDAAEKVTYERKNWLRLVCKVNMEDVKYPAYQFEKSSDVSFYLLDAYEEAFEKAAKESVCPPKYIKNGEVKGPILKVNYIYGESHIYGGHKRFSFYYYDEKADRVQLSNVFSLNEHGKEFAQIVDWFIKEDKAFEMHYNKILKRTLERKPSEIVDATNPNIVTVINPANVAVVCTDECVWPTLTHITKINNKMLPVREDYKNFLKQDMANPVAFNEIKTAQGRTQIGWKYMIKGATHNVSLKRGREKVKANYCKIKSSLWQKLVRWSFRERIK